MASIYNLAHPVQMDAREGVMVLRAIEDKAIELNRQAKRLREQAVRLEDEANGLMNAAALLDAKLHPLLGIKAKGAEG